MDIDKIKQDFELLKAKTKRFESEAKLEADDDYVAAEILIMFLDDKPVTTEQIIFLKKQSIDFAKVLALIGLQAVPGSSVAIVMLQKVAVKHGFSLFPNPEKAPEV